MLSKLLLYMLSYFGVMAVGPALFLLAVFVFKVNADNLFVQHPFGVCLTIALYMSFVILMFFCLQDVFIVFKPAPGTSPVSGAELINRLEKTFNSSTEGKKLFDFMKSNNKVVVTWSSSIDYFQLTSGGSTSKKRVIVLTIDEKKHNVFFIMKDKDWQWNLSKNFFEMSLNYSTGISAELSTEYRPAIAFSEDGGLKVDMKKLTYDSNELWLPIQSTALSSGWTLRGGMLPIFYHRILLALLFALIVFFLLYPLMRGSTHSKEAPGKTAPPAKTESRDVQFDVVAHLEKNMSYITTENIQFELEQLMKTQKNLVNQHTKSVFAVYAKNYFLRKDLKPDFESKIRIFAKENEINGLKQH